MVSLYRNLRTKASRGAKWRAQGHAIPRESLILRLSSIASIVCHAVHTVCCQNSYATNAAPPSKSRKNRFRVTKRKVQYWVIPPKHCAEFVAAMERVQDTYHLPYDPEVPVVTIFSRALFFWGGFGRCLPSWASRLVFFSA